MENTTSKNKTTRSPIVSVMGHIDHGKSTLLDFIRKSNIVENEAGGITQKIIAYEVIRKNDSGQERHITFIDTPGHEAFKKMRACGARTADIAILVVSAEDGVKPQTIEALQAIKEAGAPYIVAINKIDKPEANIERTKQSLAENEIYVEGYGGTVPVVAISAKIGTGIEELLDMILLTADINELTGNPSIPASGFVIESRLNSKKGLSATLVIKDGTWQKGYTIVAGKSFSPARVVENYLGKQITSATFSSPIRVYGFDILPKAGCEFKCFTNKKEAESYIKNLKETEHVICSKKHNQEENNDDIFPIIIKADTYGSLEAVIHEIEKLKLDRIKTKIILSGVGEISENDIKFANGDNRAVIAGFNVSPDPKAKSYAERLNIPMETFDVIYKLIEWIEKTLKEKQPRITVEEIHGTIKVLKNFSKSKDSYIVGGRVESGEVSTGENFKVFRREAEIGKGKIKGLQQNKKETNTVGEGNEFGGNIVSSIEIAPGDKIQTYITVIK